MWCDPSAGQGSKVIPFFQFMNKLGRRIVVAQNNREPVAAKIWHTYHVPHTTIAKFWQQLWKQQEARKITMFQWLLIHRSLPVWAWPHGILCSPNCVACPNEIESIWHALWDSSNMEWGWQIIAIMQDARHIQVRECVGYHGWPQLTDTKIKRRGWHWWQRHKRSCFPPSTMFTRIPINVKDQVVLELVSPITLWTLSKQCCRWAFSN